MEKIEKTPVVKDIKKFYCDRCEVDLGITSPHKIDIGQKVEGRDTGRLDLCDKCFEGFLSFLKETKKEGKEKK